MSTFSTELINKLGFLISFAPISSLPVSLFHVSSFMAMHPTATSAGSRGLARITYSPAVQSDAPTSFLCLIPQLPNKCFKHENQERALFSNYRFRSQIMFSLLKKPALSPAGKIRAIILLWIRGESKKISNLTLCILTASAL